MKKILLILMLILVGCTVAQSPSSGLTTNLRLKMYAEGARGIADSINWNWQTIDAWVADSTARLSANNTWTGSQIFVGNNTYNGTNTFNKEVIVQDSLQISGWMFMDSVLTMNSFGKYNNDPGISLANGYSVAEHVLSASDNKTVLYSPSSGVVSYAYKNVITTFIDTLATKAYARSVGGGGASITKLSDIANHDTLRSNFYADSTSGFITGALKFGEVTNSTLKVPYADAGTMSIPTTPYQIYIYDFGGTSRMWYSDGTGTERQLGAVNNANTWSDYQKFYEIRGNINVKSSGSTIDATNQYIIKLDYSSTITITSITNGSAGQQLIIFNGTNFNATFQDGVSLQCPSSADLIMGGYDVSTWLCVDGTVWICISHTDNS